MRAAIIFLLILPFPASAGELGRFFFTPQERQAFDAQASGTPATPVANGIGGTVTVSGIVKRSSGKYTAWINGVPYTEADAANRFQFNNRGSGSITVPASGGKNLTLKAGQTGSPQSGQVTEPYQSAPVPPPEAK